MFSSRTSVWVRVGPAGGDHLAGVCSLLLFLGSSRIHGQKGAATLFYLIRLPRKGRRLRRGVHQDLWVFGKGHVPFSEDLRAQTKGSLGEGMSLGRDLLGDGLLGTLMKGGVHSRGLGGYWEEGG